MSSLSFRRSRNPRHTACTPTYHRPPVSTSAFTPIHRSTERGLKLNHVIRLNRMAPSSTWTCVAAWASSAVGDFVPRPMPSCAAAATAAAAAARGCVVRRISARCVSIVRCVCTYRGRGGRAGGAGCCIRRLLGVEAEDQRLHLKKSTNSQEHSAYMRERCSQRARCSLPKSWCAHPPHKRAHAHARLGRTCSRRLRTSSCDRRCTSSSFSLARRSSAVSRRFTYATHASDSCRVCGCVPSCAWPAYRLQLSVFRLVLVDMDL
jgi:hypothetical protein